MKKFILCVALILLGSSSPMFLHASETKHASVIKIEAENSLNFGSATIPQTMEEGKYRKLTISTPGPGDCPSAFCEQGEGTCRFWKVALMNVAFALGHQAEG